MLRHIGLIAAAATVVHAQRVDTTATKRAILTLDSARAAAVKRNGFGAMLAGASGSAPNYSLLVPGLPIVRVAGAATKDASARYAGGTLELVAQHALVSADGLLGCVLGVTRIHLAGDTSATARNGRYATCWRRDAVGAPWRVAVHSENGEAAGLPVPDAALAGAPRSATQNNAHDDAAKAVAADRAFAKLAVDSGAGAAFSRFAAPDAMLMGARAAPRRGREEISAAFQGSTSKFIWAPVESASFGTGGLAFTVGEAVITTGADVSHTKYLTIWRLEADGTWKYVIDIGSERP